MEHLDIKRKFCLLSAT